MRFRSWWFLAFWATAGVVGFAWLFPNWLPLRLASFGGSDRATFENVAVAISDEGIAANSIAGTSTDESGGFAAPLPVVLKEASPSDHGSGLEDVMGFSPDGLGSAASGVGMTGSGSGGGGTGIGTIGYGSLGSFGNGSGTTAATPPPPTPRMAAPTSAYPPDLTAGDDHLTPSAPTDLIGAPDIDAEPIGAGISSPGAEFDNILDEIDRKLACLPLGNIAFNAPETIPLGEMAAIELLVSLAETEEQLRTAVRAAGPVESASVHVSPYMEAQLNGAGFRIESATPARQLLSRSERTRWRWQIEPTRADTLELTLTLSALFSVDGQERTRAIRTFEKTIVVDVPITHRLAQFIGNNQEWLGTALIIPVLGAVYRMFRRKRQAESPEPGEMDRRAA
jgi:hypothetical protein